MGLKVDGDGKVQIRDLATNKIVSVWPIDAREQLTLGTAAPVDEDVLEHKSVAQHVPPAKDPQVNNLPVDFTKMPLNELKELARQAGVQNVDIPKSDLIKALTTK
jgi:hypothetical protein